MPIQMNKLAGALALAVSAAAAAQTAPAAQQTAPAVTPQSPANTKTTTTQSSTSTAVVPDQSGGAATQRTTDTTSTTTTQPANAPPSAPATSSTSRTTSTTTTPDEPGAASTTTTTTTQAPTDKTGAAIRAATAADVKAGVPVFDSNGGVVGKIDSVSGKNAVVSTGAAKAAIPISSFAKNDKGLVMSMTKSQLDAAAKQSAPKAAAKTTKKPK